jgi:hypothetical protein
MKNNDTKTSDTVGANPPRRTRTFRIFGSIALVALIGGSVWAYQNGTIPMMMGHALAQSTHSHGADGTGHDEVNMPGLRGKDATKAESAELAVLFRNFEQITREVTNLDNGIRTITYSADEDLMSTVVSHVVGMIDRVDQGRDPQIIIQSATLDILFERRERIVTEIETTDQGIVVIQTSEDPEVVAALQTHAAEVSGMVDRGMGFVHDAMMKNAGN